MPRVPRSSLSGGLFHITSRSLPETPLFRVDADRREFVGLLTTCVRRHGWTCHAYCLMSTHYHLVVESYREALSQGLCELNGNHARRFNRRHGRFGHLFAERFAVRLIDSEEYLYDACAYVVLNPVKAALCDRADQWPWSYSRFGLE